MNIIYTECNIHYNSIDIYPYADYIWRIDCWEAEKNQGTSKQTTTTTRFHYEDVQNGSLGQ